MPGKERQQQLDDDGERGLSRYSALFSGQYQRHQHRGDDDARKVGKGRAAHGAHDIAARHGGEGDRALHGRGEQREIDQPGAQPRIEEGQGGDRKTKQREHAIGHGADCGMEAPMPHPVDHRLAREPRAVKEEQQHNADIGGPSGDSRPDPARRQERGKPHRAQQQQDIGVDLEAGEEGLHAVAFVGSAKGSLRQPGLAINRQPRAHAQIDEGADHVATRRPSRDQACGDNCMTGIGYVTEQIRGWKNTVAADLTSLLLHCNIRADIVT